MNLLYFSGGPRERVLARLIASHTVERVYVNSPRKYPKVVPTIELANSHNIPVTVIAGKYELANILPEIEGRACFSAGFSYVLPPEFMKAARFFLNIHGTLLPNYRGMAAPWIIDNGETETGITVHLMDNGADTGDIILQRKIPVFPFDTYRSMIRRVHELEPAVAAEALSLIEQHGISIARPQGEPSVASIDRKPHHSELDPSKSLNELFDKIRASDADKFPAYFFRNGEKVCIRMWRPEKPEDEADMI